MIRKLKDGKYRLYSRKKNPKTGLRRDLGTFATRKEAEAQPGLNSVFNNADRHPDGRLDKVEYARARGMIGPN